MDCRKQKKRMKEYRAKEVDAPEEEEDDESLLMQIKKRYVSPCLLSTGVYILQNTCLGEGRRGKK